MTIDDVETDVETTANRLYRRTDGRVIAGVAAGIADHLRLPVAAVRVAFVALLAFSGIGVVLYVVFWTVLPATPSVSTADGHGRTRDTTQLVVFGVFALGVLLVGGLIGDGLGALTIFGWLIALVALGGGIIWHQAEPERWRRWNVGGPELPWLAGVLAANDRRSLLLRLIGGGALVISGIIGIIALTRPVTGTSLSALVNGLLFALIALAGLTLALGPLLWRIFERLRVEREGRIREKERAELAAIVHDQVLHTLALVQRHSDDPKMVLRLARGQERSLRNWLYKPVGSPDERFAAAMEAAAAEVEENFPLSVDLVVVGDCGVDERIRALVHATREAMVNAAKHSGVETVSVYAEVEAGEIAVFVRDRGVGFNLSDVDDDRHGVRGSIIGRMERHGGRAEVKSAPGEGTEVRLVLAPGNEGE